MPLYLKAIVYGRPGSGKTTLAASGHDTDGMRDTLVADFEGGCLSISDTTALVTPLIRTLADIEKLYVSLSTKAEGFENVNLLVLDSGTKFQEIILADIMRKNVEAGASKKDGTPRTEDDLELQDYGKATKICMRILQRFRDLPMHVIVTALAKETSPEATLQRPNPPPTDCRPDFMKKLGEHAMAYFDHVWLMARDSESGEHSMLTQRKGIYTAKTRGHAFAEALGDVVTNPKLPEILGLLQETQGKGAHQ